MYFVVVIGGVKNIDYFNYDLSVKLVFNNISSILSVFYIALGVHFNIYGLI